MSCDLTGNSTGAGSVSRSQVRLGRWRRGPVGDGGMRPTGPRSESSGPSTCFPGNLRPGPDTESTPDTDSGGVFRRTPARPTVGLYPGRPATEDAGAGPEPDPCTHKHLDYPPLEVVLSPR